MRLCDAGQRRHRAKTVYPFDPLLGSPKTRPRDRSNRLLATIYLSGQAHLNFTDGQ